ncbi:winged helix DNA-binding domain-containing protein [Candidatus Bathyarchaeota archaeon]|nr:winged helix DNA-binding domain-containing protein [Candidatus Bathyarchaeota archaeon]
MSVMRDLGYLQIDPMRIVAPSHLLVLWSRLGPFEPSILDALLWKDRLLFEDWAQAASIVLTEDYPIFSALKRGFATSDSPWANKIRSWMEKNKSFSAYILTRLARSGPLLSSQFEDKSAEDWSSTGWTAGRNVDMMLTFLKAQGKIMIAGRNKGQRLWDLTEHFLPSWVSREKLSDDKIVHHAVEKSLRALGVARAEHIKRHYIRGCYGGLEGALTELESEGQIVKMEIREGQASWRGTWYVHADDLSLVDRLETGDWEPRTSLLSPFDNLISDRLRAEQLFCFSYRFEVYVPKLQRKYGCYVMPILHGDRFIGRIDPVMDRKNGILTIKAVCAEPDAPKSNEAVQAIANAIEELRAFLGAKEIQYGSRVPAVWKSILV